MEAAQADYRAALSAVNALGANQREHSLGLHRVETRLDRVEIRSTSVEATVRDGFRSVDEQLAEIKDLIIGRD